MDYKQAGQPIIPPSAEDTTPGVQDQAPAQEPSTPMTGADVAIAASGIAQEVLGNVEADVPPSSPLSSSPVMEVTDSTITSMIHPNTPQPPQAHPVSVAESSEVPTGM